MADQSAETAPAAAGAASATLVRQVAGTGVVKNGPRFALQCWVAAAQLHS
jgi:hypothetical protein